MSEHPRRRYRAPGRQAKARSTRRTILDAAQALFDSQGYAGTSIQAVAEAAGVSQQTVYNGFKDKPTLLAAVARRLLSTLEAGAGEDYRSQLLAEPDQRKRIEIAAAWSRTVWEGGMLRFASMLLDAAGADPRAAEVARAIWRRRYEADKPLFAMAFPEASRPPGDDADEAYDVYFALDNAAFVRILIDTRGWSYDTYQRWVATILTRLFTRLEADAG